MFVIDRWSLHTHTHTHTHTVTHTHTHTHTYTHTHMYTHMCAHAHSHTHTRARAHTVNVSDGPGPVYSGLYRQVFLPYRWSLRQVSLYNVFCVKCSTTCRKYAALHVGNTQYSGISEYRTLWESIFVLCKEVVLFGWSKKELLELQGESIQGPQAVFFVGRLSLFRSVHYQRIHCSMYTTTEKQALKTFSQRDISHIQSDLQNLKK